MTNINNAKADEIFRFAASKYMRILVKSIGKDGSFKSRNVSTLLGDANRGNKYHWLKHALDLGILKREEDNWFLTSIGIEILDIILKFEKYCVEYDMNDIDKDGKIVSFVINRIKIND